MKFTKIYHIALDEKEAISLKIFLGATSEDERIKLGLSREQSEILTNLYDQLPCIDE